MGPTASEKDVLEIIAYYKKANNTLLSRKMQSTTEYTNFLCKSLVKNGYLSRIGSGLYTLTLTGEAVVEKMKK
jgi:DNA-binding IclR family transcriptional regulator